MTAAGERQKRLRARQRNGEVVVPVTVTNEIIATLIDLGWLTERESEDRRQIGCAIRQILSDLAVAHTPKKSVTRLQRDASDRGPV